MARSRKRKSLSLLRWLLFLPIPAIWCALEYFNSLDFWESRTEAWRFVSRGEISSPAKIVYIDIDTESIKAIGNWPWTRDLFADVIRALVDEGGVKAVGFDIDPRRVKEAEDNVRSNKVEHLATIRQQDIFTLDLREASVVTLYLLPDLNVRLMPQLARLKPGSRIVSHDFDMKGAKPVQVRQIHVDRQESSDEDYGDGSHTIYKWVVPWESDLPKSETPDAGVGTTNQPASKTKSASP